MIFCLAALAQPLADAAEATIIGDPADTALRAYENGDLDQAQAILGEAEKRGDRNGRLLDIRGCVLLEQGKFDQALEAFQAERELEPKTHSRVHIGDVFARQKKWEEARAAYEAAIKTSDVLVVNERLRFAIFISHLGSKNEEAAQEALRAIPFPTETAAYYYAQAAWAFAHGKNREGDQWLRRGQNIFKPRQTAWFARHLYEFGWLKAKPPLVLE